MHVDVHQSGIYTCSNKHHQQVQLPALGKINHNSNHNNNTQPKSNPKLFCLHLLHRGFNPKKAGPHSSDPTKSSQALSLPGRCSAATVPLKNWYWYRHQTLVLECGGVPTRPNPMPSRWSHPRFRLAGMPDNGPNAARGRGRACGGDTTCY